MQAQAFDGTWTGKDGCPLYGNMQSWSEARRAIVVQNQFRFERNSPTLYELTEGTVKPDGTITASGQGQRRDRPVRWTAQFSGKASSTEMRLTGTRSRGRPCSMELSNTRPAPYSLAGLEIARQQKFAQDEADKRAEGEHQGNADAARQAALGRAQRDKSAKEQAAETQLRRMRSDADATKQKAAELENKFADRRSTQEGQKQATDETQKALALKQRSAGTELEQLRAEAEAARQRAVVIL